MYTRTHAHAHAHAHTHAHAHAHAHAHTNSPIHVCTVQHTCIQPGMDGIKTVARQQLEHSPSVLNFMIWTIARINKANSNFHVSQKVTLLMKIWKFRSYRLTGETAVSSIPHPIRPWSLLTSIRSACAIVGWSKRALDFHPQKSLTYPQRTPYTIRLACNWC